MFGSHGERLSERSAPSYLGRAGFFAIFGGILSPSVAGHHGFVIELKSLKRSRGWELDFGEPRGFGPSLAEFGNIP